jgi:hypothetical protein
MRTVDFRFWILEWRRQTVAVLTLLLAVLPATAKVDLVTLPERESVQVTIYNSADLTLVRESRGLTLKEGKNALQFSWESTLIDPTSLAMIPLANADRIEIAELAYPARVQNTGIWNIASGVNGRVPFAITYLTSGLSWRAFYMGTLTEDEKAMRLTGYVVVTNNSGEDYENAQTRLIVGQVHLLDQIGELARQQYPYGRPGLMEGDSRMSLGVERSEVQQMFARRRAMEDISEAFDQAKQKEVVKEGLSEYFLYTIEGKESIPTGWSKRLQSFDITDVPVMNLYKFEEERYGTNAVRFLSFKNDTDHKLGTTPIPGGMLKVYRGVDKSGHFSYEGQSEFKYIPVGEKVELNIGEVADVAVEPKLMSLATENMLYDDKGNLSGWDELRTYKVEVRNSRDVAAKLEIKRNFTTQYWRLEKSGEAGDYEQYDATSAKFTLDLPQHSCKTFEYTLHTFHGTREEAWRN